MNRLVRIILKAVIAVAALFVIYIILTIDAVDSRLSALIYRPREEGKNAVVYTEWADSEYEKLDTDRPCIFARDGRLIMAVGNVTADITPDNINAAYYAALTDFNDALKYKKNCYVTDDERYIVYSLEFNEIPYLYYYDIILNKAYCIAERIDSFRVIENDGGDCLTILYATGYEQSNKLYIYRSDETGDSAGENELIAENVTEAGVFEAYRYVVYLKPDGSLYRYSLSSGASGIFSDNVEKVYFPGNTKYNYDDFYDDFTVCCRRNGEDKIINGVSEASITEGYYGMIPEFTYRQTAQNSAYKGAAGSEAGTVYYTKNSMRLTFSSEGAQRNIYTDIGKIYYIFGYAPADRIEGENASDDCVGCVYIIAANENSIYLLRSDGAEAIRIMELPFIYRKNADMLEKHMKIYMCGDTFYVSMLTTGSLVVNPKNTDSWMNALNSYNYGLTAIVRQSTAAYTYTPRKLDIPPSRSMNAPAPVSLNDPDGYLIYNSYFSDGSIKSCSVISDGSVVLRDMFSTSGLAEKQRDIRVLPCASGTYFIIDNNEYEPSEREFYFMPQNAQSIEPVCENGKPITDIYDDFDAESSFGTLVIFSKERYN